MGLADEPTTEGLGDDGVTGVRTSDGTTIAVDAIFTAGTVVPHDALLADLALERVDSPLGDVLAVDETGRTSNDRIWAVGNVVNPPANIPCA